jgi:hypothetical protein
LFFINNTKIHLISGTVEDKNDATYDVGNPAAGHDLGQAQI